MTPESHDFSEFIQGRDRILMAAWTLPNEGPLTDTQRRQAMENFKAYRLRVGHSPADVAHEVNSPRESTIRELEQGKYREGCDKNIRTLNAWVEQHARQQEAKIKGKFVQTKVAMEILGAAKLVRENQTMGLVYGPSGIGKTRCAQALLDSYVGTVLVTVRHGCYSPKGLVSVLADRLGVRTFSKQPSNAQYQTQIERVITRLKGSGRLLLVDEAHKLTDEAIEVLREIHDESGSPILLFSTKELHDRIVRNADPDRGQVYSRFDVDYPLTQGHTSHAGGNKPLFTVEEIRKLYETPPIKLSPDALRYLRDVANSLGRGSLRRCTLLLQNAARRARKRLGVGADESVTVTADDLAYTEERLRREVSELEEVATRRQAAVATA